MNHNLSHQFYSKDLTSLCMIILVLLDLTCCSEWDEIIVSELMEEILPDALKPYVDSFTLKIKPMIKKIGNAIIPGNDVYDIITAFNMTSNAEATRLFGKQLIKIFNTRSSYDFFKLAGSNPETLNKVLLIATLIQSETKIKNVLTLLIDDHMMNLFPIIGLSIQSGSFDTALIALFNAINIDLKFGKQVLISVLNNIDSITLGDISKSFGFKMDALTTFTIELEKTFNNQAGTTFVEFIENLGFVPKTELLIFNQSIDSIFYGQEIILADIYKQMKEGLMPLI